jgi:mRNA interferase RelE/StbE
MSYKIIARKQVKKFIDKRIPKEKETILEKLKLLKSNPYPANVYLDIKRLKNSEFYRLRINNYRIIYEIIDNELVILMLEADSRGDIY